MKYLLLILLPLFLGLTPKEESMPLAYRSFYKEMKSLEKPSKVTAFAAVQTVGGSPTGSTITITLSSTGAGNLIVISMFTTEIVTSITDNVSNTYVIGASVDYVGYYVYQSYGVQVNGGNTSISVTVANSSTVKYCADEYSGGAATNALCFDVRTTGSGAGTALSVATLTPAATGELIVATGFNGGNRSYTEGSGYTNYGNSSSGVRSQYKLSSAATETAPWTLSSSAGWREIASAFKEGVAATNNSKFFF